MRGTFKITLAYLKELGACRDGQRAFQKEFPDGGEYQEILDRCAEEGRLDFGSWLLEHIGPTEDVRTYEDVVDKPQCGIIFAGKIEFKVGAAIKFIVSGRGIEAGEGIKAGRGIEAGEGIKAGRGIEAGEGIKAGRGIEAGDDFCVFAGLGVRKSFWEFSAIVSASAKPRNLISGFWEPLEGHDEGTV